MARLNRKTRTQTNAHSTNPKHTHTQQQTRKTRTQVAPGAGIAALDVFASDYGAFDSDVIRGVNWAVRARAAHGVCVINLRCVGGAGGC